MTSHLIAGDYARYFFEKDGLGNVKNEIFFSLLKRYNCFAGCKICYTESDFKRALPRFNQFIPDTIDPELEQEWFKVFNYFYSANNIDDIFWMKHEQPHLYDWYLKHNHRFRWGNMTDNNFIRSHPLFINEFAPEATIYEITFSSEWLEKVNPDDIVKMLNVLNDRNGISKLKFIFNSEEDYKLPGIQKLFEWTVEKGIDDLSGSHHNFMGKTKILKDAPKQADFCASDDGKIYNVLQESDYIQYDNFFLTLHTSIDVDSIPYYKFKTFDSNKHLVAMLQGKINLYAQWAYEYNTGKIVNNPEAQPHFEYFDWVSKNIKVNQDYNFIPIDLLDGRYRYYHKLIEDGWTTTDYGLFNGKLNNGVKPLIEVKNG